MKQHLNYRLGLDMGISSIGWSVVEVADDKSQTPLRVVDMGVRKFNSGREDKTQAPLAAKRRQKRSMRRQRARFLRRQNKLINKLVDLGLMPTSPTERRQLADCTHPQITALALKQATPYHLRAAALDDHLSAYALGRVLFALNQRRGFLSNRKGDKESASKEFYEGINTLKQSLNNHKTLGAYLAWRLDNNLPVLDSRAQSDAIKSNRSGLQTDRSMYETEFDIIRDAQEQSPHHRLTSDDWDALKHIIFHQRPLKEVERGNCQVYGPQGHNFERAYAADPLAQQLRIWQDINNLKIMEPGAKGFRHLTDEERQKIWQLLQTEAQPSLKTKVRLHLGLEAGTVFNLSTAKTGEKLTGLLTDITLSKPEFFGNRWHTFSTEDKSAIIDLVQRTQDLNILINTLMDDWGLTEEAAEKVTDLKLETGTSRFCTRALAEMVQLMSTTCTDKASNRYISTTEAMAELAGGPQYRQEGDIPTTQRLPYYAQALPEVGMHHRHRTAEEERKYGIIGNPSVHIALNQLRHVVNAIIDTYGLPHSIAIELARDMKLSKKERDARDKQNKENAKRRERMVAEAQEARVAVNKDNREDFLRYKLWEELSADPCNRKCPYTGETINISKLFSNDVHIEHILPRSRTLDDSPANLTLATRDANKMKGNETPYEYFKRIGDDVGYQELLERVKDFPRNKQWRFMKDAMERLNDEERWLSSMLNDTRYMSKIAHKYLHLVCKNVQVSPGRLTAKARGQWFGAVEGLEKNRDADHRHHALDALTVALLSRSAIQKSQTVAGLGQDGGDHHYQKLKLPCPMDKDALRAQTQQLMGSMLVSHRIDHGIEGQLHLETAIKHTDKGVQKFIESPADATQLVAIPHKQGDVEHTNYYAHGGIHHIDFWLVKEKDKKGKIKERVEGVPVYAHQAFLPDGKTFQSRPHPAAKFLMRLHKGDVIVLDGKEQPDIPGIICQINPSQSRFVYTSPNKPFDSKGKLDAVGFTSLLKYNTRKAHIDILGRLKVGRMTTKQA